MTSDLAASADQPQPANWKNVNNWHWVEKNCLPWSQEYFGRFLKVQSAEEDWKVEVTDVSKCEGDVDLNVRKGRVIYLFDLELELNWTGTKGDVAAKGTIKMKDCVFDEEPEDYDTCIEIESETTEKRVFKDLIKTHILPQIHAVFHKFPKDLLAENGPSVLVKDSAVKYSDPLQQEKLAAVVERKQSDKALKSSTGPTPASLASGNKLLTATISMTSEFKASRDDLMSCLVDHDRVQIWTGERAQISREAQSSFSLLNGSVSGTIISVSPDNTQLVMDWRLKQWPSGHVSRVTMSLDQGSDSTTLRLKQEGVPKSDELQIRDNWENIYFNRIKHIFGYVL